MALEIRARDIILTDLNVELNNVRGEIWFRDVPDAFLSRWETAEILNYVLATEDLGNVTIDQVLSA